MMSDVVEKRATLKLSKSIFLKHQLLVLASFDIVARRLFIRRQWRYFRFPFLFDLLLALLLNFYTNSNNFASIFFRSGLV
ncbi:hypothetical protein L2E82_20410 [Cichorium intybus]|uniref:Uncharacterized protein n=1 Tax=Cichorium intybus TaxID=13427 RepID=A0ACB9DT15_CICIN|nr:hypothetical protein L2E82_20410 [Cichorium intybus]